MLTETERETALEIVMGAKSPEAFPIINDQLCRQFPNITTEDLVSLWREAGERQVGPQLVGRPDRKSRTATLPPPKAKPPRPIAAR